MIWWVLAFVPLAAYAVVALAVAPRIGQLLADMERPGDRDE